MEEISMQINQRKDGSIELKLTDDEIKIMKENDNTFHIDIEKTKDSLDIIMLYLWKIFDGLPEKVKKRMQTKHPPDNYNPKS
jgi:hypothetical protein